MNQSVDPSVGQARARWRQAQQALSKHELKSDPALDLDLLKRARQFPAWRGVAALAASWALPHVPQVMGAGDDPFAQAVFAGVGAVVLCFALWWLIIDGRQWFRWARARRDLSQGRYGSRNLALSLGLPNNANLTPVPMDSEEWNKLGEWVKIDRQLRKTWEGWAQKNAPVRRYDMRVLEEAVMALARVREVKSEEPGKTSVKAPTQPPASPTP